MLTHPRETVNGEASGGMMLIDHHHDQQAMQLATGGEEGRSVPNLSTSSLEKPEEIWEQDANSHYIPWLVVHPCRGYGWSGT